jgi:anti-anti-sigma factor
VAATGTIQVEIHSADAAVVTLRGEHDLESQPRVAAALTAAGVCPHVVVDLSACTFADSSLIAALLRGARVIGERGGTLPLVVGPEARSVRRTLDLMGIATILPLHGSRAEALGAIAGAAVPAAHRRAA